MNLLISFPIASTCLIKFLNIPLNSYEWQFSITINSMTHQIVIDSKEMHQFFAVLKIQIICPYILSLFSLFTLHSCRFQCAFNRTLHAPHLSQTLLQTCCKKRAVHELLRLGSRFLRNCCLFKFILPFTKQRHFIAWTYSH